MALKRSSLALLASALVALIAYGPGLQAEAAPIDRFLALIPSSQQHNDDSAPLQPAPQPSLGRAQIRPIGQRQPSFRPSSDHSTGPSSSQIPSDTSASTWSDRTLGGHAVLDDDDDDAGNELLDTESDGLLRPDADDEIEGTIEGEVLEEEEGYGNENEIEYDDGEDDDSNDGDLYEPWLTMPPPSTPSRLTHREARRTRLRGEDEKGF
ncbi:hypothetical protein EC957_006018 [Mortierella hygrophila]|uniref:Uncharacterized protein n=1 Tax=Mortierella hygrophila TaxID=979708 RepID=A0A9P6F071_9FUNG|nr:hypothetical protein EC957_006018 [Mortierella hygrophila]